MNKPSIAAMIVMASASAFSQVATNTPTSTNAPAAPKTVSIQEMLVIGHSGMKLHALAMLTQGKYTGEIDESFLPGFTACANDTATPVRSVAARLIGQYFIKDQEKPNAEAMALLTKLAKDDVNDVSYSAVYYGLSEMENKPNNVIELLIDVATTNREQSLYDRIVDSLKEQREQVAKIMDAKLKEGDNIAIYEIYEDLTGKKPGNADKYLEMPSSRPRLFIFKGEGSDQEAYKAELEKTLTDAGISNHDIMISGTDENYVLLVKTYITKDNEIMETRFSKHDRFKLTQDLWLTPELEIQIDSMRNKQ